MLSDLSKTLRIIVFKAADYEFDIEFAEKKMVSVFCKITTDSLLTLYMGVFEVIDYKFDDDSVEKNYE